MRRRAWLPWLWLLPAGAVLLPFFILPLALVVRDSVYRDTPDGVTTPAFTDANYAHVLGDPYYLTVFGNTLIVAAIVTALALVIAYPFAQLVVRASARARILLLWCVYLPLYVSVIMRAFGWMVVTADSGLLNEVLLATGLAERPVRILYEASGMTLGMLHRYLPLMIIPLVSALQKIDDALPRASLTLGAGRWFTWRHVTLPLSLPGVFAGVQLVFAGVLSDYALPALMGSTRFQMAAPAIYYESVTNGSWGLGGAMSTLLLGFVAALLVAANLVLRRIAPWSAIG